jgi:hypothetical protein
MIGTSTQIHSLYAFELDYTSIATNDRVMGLIPVNFLISMLLVIFKL